MSSPISLLSATKPMQRRRSLVTLFKHEPHKILGRARDDVGENDGFPHGGRALVENPFRSGAVLVANEIEVRPLIGLQNWGLLG